MTELGHALEALSGWPQSPELDLPELLHRHERRQARRRSIAAVVALALVAGAIALAA